MMPWFFRYIARMAGYLAAMLLVVWIGFVLYRQSGIDRVYWVPVNFGIVAVAGYDTVKRLPLVWGALVGGLVAGIVDLCTWPLGTLVGQGRRGPLAGGDVAAGGGDRGGGGRRCRGHDGAQPPAQALAAFRVAQASVFGLRRKRGCA